MKRFYHGNAKPYVLAVSHPQDRKAVQPVLEEMDSRGLYLCHREGRDASNSIIRRACAVVLFLSPALAGDKRLPRIALEAKESEVPVICVYLEPAELPEDLKRLLYASNAIPAGRYEDAKKLVDRLLTAESIRDPQITKAQQHSRRRRNLLLSLLVFLALATAFIVFVLPHIIPPPPPPPSPSPVQATPAPTPMPTVDPNTLVQRLILAGDIRLDEKQSSDTDWSARVWQHENNGETEWMLDGKTLPRGTAESLAFIQPMVNLKELVLINQKFSDLSPLVGLEQLRSLQVIDCPVEDIGTLAGAASLSFLELRDTLVSDLTSLEALPRLSSFSYAGRSGTELISLNGLSSTRIHDISLRNVNSLKDLSPLETCKSLSSLFIEGATSLEDVSALAQCGILDALDLHQVSSLKDLSALAGTKSLRWLNLSEAGVSDLSSLSGLKGLRGLSLSGLPFSDMSFLSETSQLEFFQFGGTRLRSLDFLNKYTPGRIDTLFVNDQLDDYSGLKAMGGYQSVNLNMNGKSLSALEGVLRELTISELSLFNCRNIDFAALPEGLTSLSIYGGNLQDLSGLKRLPKLRAIEIGSINTLVSLSGMENFESLDRFSVDNCLRLSSWDALYNTRVDHLTLKNLVFHPEMERLKYSGQGNFSLTLENLPELKSLSFMDSIPYDASRNYSNIEIRLAGMDHLINLEPVRRLSPTFLSIPPTLEEQAAQMLEAKDIFRYEVVYANNVALDGSAFDFQLLSLDELETLPDVLLDKVKSFRLAGDTLIVQENSHVENWWDNSGPVYYAVDNGTGERTPVGIGLLSDLSSLSRLSGLTTLELTAQPLNDLTGIQYLAELKEAHFDGCGFTDASPVFTLTELESVGFPSTPVESLTGLQNLPRLKLLNLNNSGVNDITALRETDFTDAYEKGGLSLLINSIPCEDLSPLAAVKQFNELHVMGLEATRWLPHLPESSVTRLLAHDCRLMDGDIAVLAALPGLRDLEIPYNQEVTDLAPLLASETLERLYISADMRGALKGLGDGARFEIVMDESNFGLLSLEELDTLPKEELAKVRTFSLAGDQLLADGREHFENNWDNGLHSYDIVDNRTGERHPAGDGFLMNLDRLAKLTGLERLELAGQPLETLEGIQGLSNLREAYFSGARFTDASPLFELAGLERISFDSTPVTTLEGLQDLKHLQSISLNGTAVSDISAFRKADFARAYEQGGLSLSIGGNPCEDLSPLSAVLRFNDLNINAPEASLWLPHLSESSVTRLMAHGCNLKDSDIPVLAALPGLRDLEIPYNQEVTDLTPLLASETLERLYISADMRGALKGLGEGARFEIVMDESNFGLLSLEELDTLPAEQLARVRTFSLAGGYLVAGGNKRIENRWENDRNVYYIVDNHTGEAFPAGESILSDLGQLSGLTGLERLELLGQPVENLQGIQGLTGLKDVTLSNCAFTDVSALFEVAGLERIGLFSSRATALTGIQNLRRLEYLDLNYSQMSDISAFEEADLAHAYDKGGLNLLISGIPCSDLSPLAAVRQFNELFVSDLEAFRWLPHLSESSVSRLLAHNSRLKDSDIPALAALPGLRDLEIPYNQEVTDLTPLLASETLERLYISADMRGALKGLGDGARFEIVMDESNFGLLSLEELDTLPAEQLSKVRTFFLVGDQLLADGREHFENNWDNGLHSYDIVDNRTGERRPAGEGILTNLEGLSGLTGLERLELAGQPLETLEGIQGLSNLREAYFSGARFTDASPLFKLEGLERISFDSTPVTTLEGLQNLKHLQSINLNGTAVSDVSAFRKADFTHAYEQGGLSLSIGGNPCEDLSPLSAVLRFNDLNINAPEASLWLPHLSESSVTRLMAHGCNLKDSDIPALAMLQGLKELEIPYNAEVTDLTPLLASETLERLYISADMRGALKGLGDGARFEIVMDESNFGLLSLEELDTLPAEQLAKVRTFSLVGDQLLADGREHFENNWDNGLHSYDIVDNQTGERHSPKKGLFTNLEKLLKLTGLERLELAGQPLESLEGIQSLSNLRDAHFSGARFTDTSPLFELAGLERISFDLTPLATLSGLQNLKRLESLNLNDSQVLDISAMRETDFTHAYEKGGLSLAINGIPCEDLSPLAAISQFSDLHVIGLEASRWLPHLADSAITRLMAHGCGLRDGDIPALAMLQGLKELEIPYNAEVTDLTPLLASGSLERLTLTRNMEKAIQSLGEQTGLEIILRD